MFLLKCKHTTAADKKRLQTEILDVCFADGAARATRCCADRTHNGRPLLGSKHPHTQPTQVTAASPLPRPPPALTPLYEHLCSELGLPKDEAKAASMRAANEAKLAELAAKVTDAEENLGETEVCLWGWGEGGGRGPLRGRQERRARVPHRRRMAAQGGGRGGPGGGGAQGACHGSQQVHPPLPPRRRLTPCPATCPCPSSQVRDAMAARAAYLGRIGDREAAAKAYAETEEKTASGAAKADMVFSQIRCGAIWRRPGRGPWQHRHVQRG